MRSKAAIARSFEKCLDWHLQRCTEVPQSAMYSHRLAPTSQPLLITDTVVQEVAACSDGDVPFGAPNPLAKARILIQ